MIIFVSWCCKTRLLDTLVPMNEFKKLLLNIRLKQMHSTRLIRHESMHYFENIKTTWILGVAFKHKNNSQRMIPKNTSTLRKNAKMGEKQENHYTKCIAHKGALWLLLLLRNLASYDTKYSFPQEIIIAFNHNQSMKSNNAPIKQLWSRGNFLS